MLVVNPSWIGDMGFILSFASTGSIMLFGNRIEKLLRKIPDFFREDLSVTLSAQIGVTPILFVMFRQFNILSPVINLLILWTVPILMILGSVGGIVGLIVPGLGKMILYLGYPMLWWFVGVVEAFS
jgi:competence protein ComEC